MVTSAFLLWCCLVAAGVTQPGGAGTKICIHDDTASASGLGYTLAEISAAFPAVIVDNGTNRKTYRCIQDIQIGDTTVDAATTTLRDTNVGIFFDTGKTLRTRATQLTSWNIRLGTKVGTGNASSGVDGCEMVFGLAPLWPIHSFIYGCTIRQTSGACLLGSGLNQTSEMVNTLVQSRSTGTAPISIGTSGGAPPINYANIYNVDISHTTSAQVMSNFGGLAAERFTCACPTPTTFLQTAGVGVSIKDMALFGSPTLSDLRWTNGTATNWVFVRPIWTGNAPKFSVNVAGATLALVDSTKEYWPYRVKCVDGAGAGVLGLPVRLTDAYGNVHVDTTTDSAGEIAFGTGITENMVQTIDHYCLSGVYTQRHRSPFLVEVNTTAQTGYNNNYFSHRYYFNWAGMETVTLSAGSFQPVDDIFTMSAAASGGSTWVERIVP